MIYAKALGKLARFVVVVKQKLVLKLLLGRKAQRQAGA